MTGVKSCPGFAVPDSVHQVKGASPCRLPLRWATRLAVVSGAWTSTASAANSMRVGPALAVRAAASPAEVRATAVGCAFGVTAGRPAAEGAGGIGAAIKAERVGFAREAGAVLAGVGGEAWVVVGAGAVGGGTA